MNLYAIGTSHKHSPVEVRERLAFSEEELLPALADLRRELASEAVIVSTCNRTEIYVVPRDESFHVDQVKEWLRRWKGMNVPNGELFALYAGGAAKHLMEVASGIDSQVVGDIQIIGQVKEAYQVARDNGAPGKLLSRLFSAALHTGKRVKTETDLFTGAVSISYVAVELAKKIFYPLADKRTLVVGAGETGELTAQNLRSQGVNNITITNRTESRGQDLIRRLGFGSWMPIDQLAARLHEFEIVIVSTGAPNYLITYDVARAASSRRNGKTQLIVDISVPRNVEPRINTLTGIFCKDLNDLNGIIESNVERRRSELPRAELIIAEELAKFSAWCNLLPVTPVIAQLKQRSEEIMRAELEKNRNRFSDADYQNVEKLVGSVVKKIIGMPMAHLLDSQKDLQHTLITAEYVKLLFNLQSLDDSSGQPDEGEWGGEDEGYQNGENRNGQNGDGEHRNGAIKKSEERNI
jgi:glutamyl-tRNA reductase